MQKRDVVMQPVPPKELYLHFQQFLQCKQEKALSGPFNLMIYSFILQQFLQYKQEKSLSGPLILRRIKLFFSKD